MSTNPAVFPGPRRPPSWRPVLVEAKANCQRAWDRYELAAHREAQARRAAWGVVLILIAILGAMLWWQI